MSSQGSSRRNLLIAGGCVALLALACLLVGGAGAAYYFYFQERPQASEPTVAYILDSSPRMAEPAEEGTRIEVAREVMAEVVRPANPELRAGLRVFGSGAVGTSCEDTELIVPYAPSNQGRIADRLQDIQPGPSSDAALAEAMIAAIRELSDGQGPHSLVIVTGGQDTCNPEAGDLIAREAERAGIELQTYVVGFDLSEESVEAVKGMIDQTPGATFYQADNREELEQVLADIQAQVNQSAAPGRAGQPPDDQDEGSEQESDGDEAPPDDGGPARQTACDHPYFPLRPGAEWHFEGDELPMTWIVTDVAGDQDSATAFVTIDFGEGQLQYEWACDQQGLHIVLAGMSFAGQAEGQVTIESTSHGSPMLLAADQFEPGASWTSEHTTTYTTSLAGVEGTFTSESQQTHTIGEPTTITVPAGTFEALPMTLEGTSTGTSMGQSFGPTEFTTMLWFAREIGLVRFESSSAGEPFRQNLASYNVP